MFNLAAHMGILMLLVTLASVSCYIAIMYKSATPMLCRSSPVRCAPSKSDLGDRAHSPLGRYRSHLTRIFEPRL